MKNPYIILRINQNASKKDIQKAMMKLQVTNKQSKKISGKLLIQCQRILLDPSKRLAADFLFPVRLKSYRPRKIEKLEYNKTELEIYNNDFSTIKWMLEYYAKHRNR